MPLTLTTQREGVMGDVRYKVLSVDFDSSYPTGGESLVPADVGWSQFFLVTAHSRDNGLVYIYDYANQTLEAYDQGMTTGSTGAADSTSGALAEDLAAAETVVRLMGSAIDTTYHFGQLREVANTSDLSTLGANVRVFIIGI